MDFLSYVKAREDEIIATTKALLKIPSVLDHYDAKSKTPFGKDIQKALDFMLDMAKKDGFITKNIRNYAAHIEHGEGEELLGVLCHLDVVPAGDGWHNPPFSPIVQDGKLYARGASDDKGPTMAAYFALKFLKELDIPLYKRVRIILGTDEETAWRCMHEYFNTEEMPTIGFAPDASFPLIYGEKGMYTFDVIGTYQNDALIEFIAGERYNVVPDYAECILDIDLKEPFYNYLNYNGFKGEVRDNKYIVHGKNAHAMTPNLGVNAAFILANFLVDHIDNDYIRFIKQKLSFDPYAEKLGVQFHDPEMKDFTLNAGVFRYHEKEVMIGINCRYPKNFDLDDAEEKIKKQIKKAKLEYRFKSNMPLHYVDPNDHLVKTLMACYQTVTQDLKSEPFTIGGGTYARALENAVAFGMTMPNRKDVAHQANEHIFIDDLIQGTAIYMHAIYELTRES